MPRRVVLYVVDLTLLAAVLLTLATGLVAGNLDLHRFALHRWSAYAVAALAAVHVAVHARVFLPARSRPPQQPGDRPPSSREETASPHVATADRDPSRRAALGAAGAGVVGVAAGWLGKSAFTPDPFVGGDVGLYYHRQSAYGITDVLADLLPHRGRPAPYERVGRGPSVALPEVTVLPTLGVGQALAQRRSLREYRDRALTQAELAWLVHAATAITSTDGRRVAPSAGALYPIETYVALSRVDGIDSGLYHVDVRGQALEPLRSGSVSGELAAAALDQDFLRAAPVVFVLAGLFQRTRWKYGDRHYRYVCWEGGHVAQNLYLAAEAAGLGACMVGSFFDGALNDLLRVDGRREAALGLVAVGPR